MNAAQLTRRRKALTFPVQPVVMVALGFFLAVAAVLLVAIADTWAAYAAVLGWSIVATVPLGLFVDKQLRLGEPTPIEAAEEDPEAEDLDIATQTAAEQVAEFQAEMHRGITDEFTRVPYAMSLEDAITLHPSLLQPRSAGRLSGLGIARHYEALTQPNLFDALTSTSEGNEDVKNELLPLLVNADHVWAHAVESMPIEHGEGRVILVLSIPNRFPIVPIGMRFGGSSSWVVKSDPISEITHVVKGKAFGGTNEAAPPTHSKRSKLKE